MNLLTQESLLSNFHVLFVDEAGKITETEGRVLIDQLADTVSMRHTYSWGGLFEIDLKTRQNIVAYTPAQGTTAKEILLRLDEIGEYFPMAKIILMTETVTGIRHPRICANLQGVGVQELIAKIKELLDPA